MPGKYIYGIIDSSNDIALGIAGLGEANPVYTVAHRGVGCVLNDYRGTDFNSMSREEVVRCLLRHQEVIEHVMREHTVLPAKFGTVLATVDEVQELLSQGHQQFVDALVWIEDKVEVEVAATWNTGQVLREISTEPEIVRARECIAIRPGQTVEDRIHLGQTVKASMDRRRDSYRERMIDFLQPVAADMQPNALVSDQMVMNVAFLVEKAKQQEFDSRVGQLNGLFDDQIDFRVIGPLPPYSFATVEVTRLNPEKIEEAKRLLHLGEVVSEPEVRRAYRRLAAETHPDHRPWDEGAKTRFSRLRQAAELLIAYCRGQADSKTGLLFSIRRQRLEEVQHLRFAETSVLAGAADG